jgi:predicted ester cyclase
MGLPPSGRRVVMVGNTLYRIQSGQVRETWWNYDALGLMQQLGAIPAPAEQAGARS